MPTQGTYLCKTARLSFVKLKLVTEQDGKNCHKMINFFSLPRSSSGANPEGVNLQAVTDKSHMTGGNEENASKSTTSKSHQEQQHHQSASKQQQQKVFKPIQNWHKIMKISSDQPLSKLTVDQVFRNVIPPYVPHVPPNTSERCIGKFSLTFRPLHF